MFGWPEVRMSGQLPGGLSPGYMRAVPSALSLGIGSGIHN